MEDEAEVIDIDEEVLVLVEVSVSVVLDSVVEVTEVMVVVGAADEVAAAPWTGYQIILISKVVAYRGGVQMQTYELLAVVGVGAVVDLESILARGQVRGRGPGEALASSTRSEGRDSLQVTLGTGLEGQRDGASSARPGDGEGLAIGDTIEVAVGQGNLGLGQSGEDGDEGGGESGLHGDGGEMFEVSIKELM